MKEFDATFLAGLQKPDYLHINERYPIQVQRDPRRNALYLRFQFIEMLRLQPADQADDRYLFVGILFNLQCHLRFL